MDPINNDNSENNSIQENITDKILEEEEKINNLLSNVTLKYPNNIFNIFLKEKIKEDKINEIENNIKLNSKKKKIIIKFGKNYLKTKKKNIKKYN